MRLGETLDEAKKSAQEANILFNVSEFETIDEFRRQLSYAHPEQDEYYERAQFMKYFGDKKICQQ